MTADERVEMADRLEKKCKDIDAVNGLHWKWGRFYETLRTVCGIPTDKLPKDDPVRTQFTTALRRVIREADYSEEQVSLHKLELVDAILRFKPKPSHPIP